MESLNGFDTNKITLLLMANCAYIEDIAKYETENRKQDKKDEKFYRKRVFGEIKNMMRGEFRNDRLQKLHSEYVHNIIQYLKDNDRTEIFQKDYPQQDSTPEFYGVDELPDNITLEEANLSLIRRSVEPVPNLDDYVEIKRVEVDKASFPKLREVNIRTNAHRTKGIKSKKDKIKTSKEVLKQVD
jgi:hypothetical protein